MKIMMTVFLGNKNHIIKNKFHPTCTDDHRVVNLTHYSLSNDKVEVVRIEIHLPIIGILPNKFNRDHPLGIGKRQKCIADQRQRKTINQQ